jgi:hypothetical protein
MAAIANHDLSVGRTRITGAVIFPSIPGPSATRYVLWRQVSCGGAFTFDTFKLLSHLLLGHLFPLIEVKPMLDRKESHVGPL